MTKIGEPLKQDVSKSGFDKFLTRPFEGLGSGEAEFQSQTGYSYDDLVSSMEGAKVQAFTTTIAFTSTDYRVVTWAAGTISYQDGLVTPEIATSNTGNMASRTYIYYDPMASKVALNVTTTAATATQGERLLLAIATPNANTAGMASVEVFGATGTYIANLSVEHLTAGSMRSKTITLAVTAGTGDCYIGTGKTDFTNTDSGFILGIDDSDADKAKFYIGDATTYLNWDAATLTVKGALTATSGAIGGWTINATSIYTGTEDHSGYTANAGDITIYSSGTDASIHAKNFYIDTSGNITATGVTLTGAITATSGAIGGWNINSTSIYTGTEDHSGYTANAGDLTIYSNGTDASIHGKNFYIDTSGNITATSVTITGALTTAASSSLSADYLDAGTISVGGASQPGSLLVNSQGGTGDQSTNAYIRWVGGSRMWEDSAHDIGLNAIGGEMYIYCNSTQVMYIGSSNINCYQHIHAAGLDLSLGGGIADQDEGSISNVDFINGYNDIRFYTATGDYTFFKNGDNTDSVFRISGATGHLYVEANQITLGGWVLTLSADKTAIVPTSKGYNALYCTESPEVWFMDFCETKDKIDSLFLEVTEEPYHFIKCEDGEYQVWGKRKGKADKRFESKTKEEFLKNEKFYNMARID